MLFDIRRHLAQRRLVASRQHYVATLLRQHERHTAPDATARSGHQCDFSSQFKVHADYAPTEPTAFILDCGPDGKGARAVTRRTRSLLLIRAGFLLVNCHPHSVKCLFCGAASRYSVTALLALCETQKTQLLSPQLHILTTK